LANRRLRPTRRQSAAPRAAGNTARTGAQQGASARAAAKPKPRWRETIDSFGGFLTIGAILGAVAIVGAIFITTRPTSTSRDVSDEPLAGIAVPATDPETDRQHISDPVQLEIPEGRPPARGPHFAVPQSVGVYDQQVPDGNTIHSLEHGVVWISYNPELVDEETISRLEDLGDDFGADTIVAPRPQNAQAIAAVSWGQILELDAFDREQLANFVETNRNRSPEPFVR
jgi:hypothetical protein